MPATGSGSLLLPLSGLLGVVLLSPSPSLGAPPRAVDLEVTPRIVDLGAVGHLQERTVEFQIRNPGAAEVRLTEIKPSCSCIRVRMSRAPLAPGETRKGSFEVGLGRAFGRFDKHIDFLAGKKVVGALRVRAHFHPGVRQEPRTLEVVGVAGRDSDGAEAFTTLLGSDPRRDLAVTFERVEGEHLEGGMERVDARTVRLRVRVLPTHPEGRVRGQLHATVNGLPVVVPVQGSVYRGLRTDPDYFNFNVIRERGSARASVRLVSTDGRSFRVLAAEFVPGPRHFGGPIEVNTKKLADDRYELTASFVDPPEAGNGPVRGTVEISTDHPEKPRIEIQCLGVFPRPAPGGRP